MTEQLPLCEAGGATVKRLEASDAKLALSACRASYIGNFFVTVLPLVHVRLPEPHAPFEFSPILTKYIAP